MSPRVTPRVTKSAGIMCLYIVCSSITATRLCVASAWASVQTGEGLPARILGAHDVGIEPFHRHPNAPDGATPSRDHFGHDNVSGGPLL